MIPVDVILSAAVAKFIVVTTVEVVCECKVTVILSGEQVQLWCLRVVFVMVFFMFLRTTVFEKMFNSETAGWSETAQLNMAWRSCCWSWARLTLLG